MSIAVIIISVEVTKVDFSLSMNHSESACTCSREISWGCNRMLIGFVKSDDQMSSLEIFLGSTLTAPVPNVETFMMMSSPN